MDIRVLRYFLAVAREESISGAAESLNLSQPTLSRQLMDLEEELGKSLFIRGSQRITLTEHGILLRKRASEILDLVDKTTNELTAADDVVTGDVYIGAGETEAVHFLTRTARQMQKQYPQVHFHISSGDTADVVDQLDKGLIDFGLLLGDIDDKKYNVITLPVYDVFGFIMLRDDPLAQKEYVTAEDMRGKPLIINRGVMEPSKIHDKPLFKNVVATYSLIYNGSLMVADGLGYMFCLDKILNLSGDSPLCFRPFMPQIKVNIGIAWKKFQVFSKASEKFLTLLRNELMQQDSD